MEIAVNRHLHDSTVPRSLTPLVGRQQEIDHLLELLDDPGIRLVTIVGPGGVGKTRLAAELAATLIDEFEREVVFVPLAAIREPDLVPLEICRAFGVTPATGNDSGEILVETLKDRDLLLVLDNFEQVLPAAVSLAAILARCPHVTLLVTSRAALDIGGEHRLPLAPLPLASGASSGPGKILESGAVSLFVARARAIRPGLVLDEATVDTIAEICRRVDGLPLAIELAAARLNVLSPQALLARLDKRLQVLGTGGQGVPDRLKTMRQAIAWSYDLLSEPEQALFRRLSVFAGGFSLDAVEAVAGNPGNSASVLDTLGALVDHSLVHELRAAGDASRYAILETLREFGSECLAGLGEEEDARERHAAWCISLAETAELHLTGNDQAAWMTRLDAEWDNIRLACSWANTASRPDVTLRTMGAIWQFITARGLAVETRPLLDVALAATAAEHSTVRCRALFTAGALAEDQRDMPRARALLEEARDLSAEIGEDTTRIRALISLAHEAHDRGDYAAAVAANTQAISLATSVGDRRSLASALGAMGNIHYFRGDLAAAREYWEHARQIVAELGDRRAEASLLGNLGAAALAQGDARRAVELHQQAEKAAEAVDDGPTLALARINQAEGFRILGELDSAAALIEEGAASLRDYGLRGYAAQALHMHAAIELARGNYRQAVSLQQASLAEFAGTGDLRSVADSAVLLAELCIAFARPFPAIELLGGATALREQLGIATNPVQDQEMADLSARLRRNARSTEFEHYWDAGHRLDGVTLAARMIAIGPDLTGVSHEATSQPAEPTSPVDTLSPREREVLLLLVAGQSSREIGETLFISPRTATTHVNNIYAKLGVNTRAQAVALGVRAGIDS